MTSANTISCPSCGTQIEVSEALSRRAEEELRTQWDSEAKGKQEEAAAAAREDERRKSQEQIGQLRQLLQQSATHLEKTREREIELEERAAELGRLKRSLEAESERKLGEMAVEQKEKLKAEAARTAELEISDLRIQLAEHAARLQESIEAELDYRKRIRGLENEKRELDLAMHRKLDEQRHQLVAAAREASAADYELKLKEKDQQIERLRQAADELKRKSEQGSVELQGEALEIDLEEKLRSAFPQDLFKPVARGARGPDVLQIVRGPNLVECGSIIWEAKNSKNWSPAWIPKLKEDQRATAANLAVLVSVSLPREIPHFGTVAGVCICSPQCVLPLAMLLRERLEQVAFARGASQARKKKTELIFDYISSDDFRLQMEGIIAAFSAMREQISRERRTMEKQWRERGKLLEIVMLNTSRMYGDLRGIAGASIRQVTSLELDPATLEEPPAMEGLRLRDLRD
jgi:hypothetical protein